MDKFKFLILLIAVVMITISSTVIIYTLLNVKEVREIDMLLKVGATSGLNADTDYIKFGKVVPGGSSTRNITLENNHDLPLRCDISASGKVSDFVSFSENFFTLQSGEKKTVSITASVPEGTPYGNYTGKMKIVFKRK